MRIVAPPDHLHGDRRGVSQRPKAHAVAPVLDGVGFWGDADAAAGRDERQPVIDIPGIPELRLSSGRPQAGGGGTGAAVDEHGTLRYLVEPDRAPPGPGIVSRQGAVAPLVTDDGTGEPVAVDGGAQDRDIAQAL